jgi:hypothetical protein
MYGLFGISSLSLITVWEQLTIYKNLFNLNLNLFYAEASTGDTLRKYNEAGILLFTDIAAIKRNIVVLNHLPLIGVVSDAPLALQSVEGLVLLDKLASLPPTPLHKALAQLKTRMGHHINLSLNSFAKVNLIDSLITEQQNQGFLHIYNSLIMAIPPNRRNVAIQATLRFMFGEISQTNYTTLMAPLLSLRSRDLITGLISYMTTPVGKGTISALQYIRRSIGRQLHSASNHDILHAIDFEQVAQKNGLEDAYELRYVTLAYRKSLSS